MTKSQILPPHRSGNCKAQILPQGMAKDHEAHHGFPVETWVHNVKTEISGGSCSLYLLDCSDPLLLCLHHAFL